MPHPNLRRIDLELNDLGRALVTRREPSPSIQNQLQDTLDELYRLATKPGNGRRPAHPVAKRHTPGPSGPG
jgi:hypothetical protein